MKVHYLITQDGLEYVHEYPMTEKWPVIEIRHSANAIAGRAWRSRRDIWFMKDKRIWHGVAFGNSIAFQCKAIKRK